MNFFFVEKEAMFIPYIQYESRSGPGYAQDQDINSHINTDLFRFRKR